MWALKCVKKHPDDCFIEANTFCMGVVALKIFILLQLFPKGTCFLCCLKIW